MRHEEAGRNYDEVKAVIDGDLDVLGGFCRHIRPEAGPAAKKGPAASDYASAEESAAR